MLDSRRYPGTKFNDATSARAVNIVFAEYGCLLHLEFAALLIIAGIQPIRQADHSESGSLTIQRYTKTIRHKVMAGAADVSLSPNVHPTAQPMAKRCVYLKQPNGSSAALTMKRHVPGHL